jgi:hypothetical protein
MQEEERMYTIKELFDDLPMSIRHLAGEVKINEVTLARIRDGKPTRRPTANKLLLFFSEIYKQKYTLRNVTGIQVMEYNRKEEPALA